MHRAPEAILDPEPVGELLEGRGAPQHLCDQGFPVELRFFVPLLPALFGVQKVKVVGELLGVDDEGLAGWTQVQVPQDAVLLVA
jgi:hypothetical protein